jgi:guanylate kinase
VIERLEAGVPVLLEIEPGRTAGRASMPEPSGVPRTLLGRAVCWLVGRGTEAADGIARRLETAQVELAAGSEFDATVVNASVEGAAADLVSLMGLSASDQR